MTFLRQFLLLLLFSPAFAQEISQDTAFLRYLYEHEQFEELVMETTRLQTRQSGISQPQLSYFKGMGYYFLKQLDSAALFLGKIPPESPYHAKSRFFQSFSYSYQKQVSPARTVLENVSFSDSLLTGLKNFELAGLALLARDEARFLSHEARFSGNYYAFSLQENNFRKYLAQIKQQRTQKMWKAAVLSALVPGAGKWYEGRLGQGIAGLLQCTFFGAQAYEGLRRDGPGSARFLIYGGFFTLFYVGNIWGSALAVKVKQQEFNNRINEQIVFDMHIPLRTIFN